MWVYHTSVRPRRPRKEGDIGDEEYREEYRKAEKLLFGMCTMDVSDIKKKIGESSEGVYRMEIPTDGDLDEIDPTSDYHVKFTKSRFLSNPKFKKLLVEYYNPKGLFVKDPQEISIIKKKKEGVETKKYWVVEFLKKK